MKENYTKNAQEAIRLAKSASRHNKQNYTGTEHLLLGLIACRLYDRGKSWGMIPVFLVAALLRPDYGVMGVATVLLFYVFREERPAQLLLLTLLNGLGYSLLSLQTFAVLAWVPISLYHGEKGRGGPWLQYGSYVFYPLHMLILGLLR